MMRSRIRFWENRFYRRTEYDEDLVGRKRNTIHELGVLWRCMGVIEGYARWLFLTITLNMALATLWVLVPWLDKILYDDVLPSQDWDGFWLIVAAWLVTDAQRNIKTHITSVLMTFLNGRMGLWLQVQYYRHLQSIPMTYIERKGVGEHMYRLRQDTIGIIGMTTHIIPNLIDQVYQFILFFFFMSLIDWRLMLVVAGYEAFYIASAQYIGTWQRKIEFYVRGAKSLADSRMQEGLAGVATVKVYGRRKAEVAGVIRRVAIQMRVEVIATIFKVVKDLVFRGRGFFPYFKTFFIMSFLYYEVIKGNYSYGLIFPILAYLNYFEQPVQKMIDLWQSVRFRLVWAERVFQVWDAQPAVSNPANPKPVPRFEGLVKAEKVDFEYENGVQVLHDISFEILPRQFVAIVGPSGSGKSTLLSLLIRMYDPMSGRITIDGSDLKEFDYSQYQQSLGLILQETFLSKESLRWNMYLGNFAATDEEIIAALERCRLLDWYKRLPDGLDSLLAEGTKVSVGEKQRLGIARALIRKSNILLLDEPTSSLDLETEAELMDVIHDVRKGKTTIQVTHRLNTVKNADTIIAMENGRITEIGTHAELLQNQGTYHRLHTLFYQHDQAA